MDSARTLAQATSMRQAAAENKREETQVILPHEKLAFLNTRSKDNLSPLRPQIKPKSNHELLSFVNNRRKEISNQCRVHKPSRTMERSTNQRFKLLKNEQATQLKHTPRLDEDPRLSIVKHFDCLETFGKLRQNMLAGLESENQSPFSEPSTPVDSSHGSPQVHHIIPVDLNLQPLYK